MQEFKAVSTGVKNLVDGDSIKKSLGCEVCIIGAGAAGITLANELSKTSIDTILVDSGSVSYHQSTQELYKANSFDAPFPNPEYTRLRYLGGSTNHWQNNTSPFTALDFEKRDGIENSGWPISYDDVHEFYEPAQKYCGVNGGGYDTSNWETLLNKIDIVKSSNTIESRIGKSAFYPTRFYNAYGNNFENSNNIKLISNANLIDVEYNEKSKKINRAHFTTLQGNKFHVDAQIFVLCCGGIENARLMLVLNNKYNNKLGNGGDNVGRYLMEHPTPRAAHAFFDGELDLSFYELTSYENKRVTAFFSLKDEIIRQEQSINLRMPLLERSNYYLSDGISSFHILKEGWEESDLPDNAMTHLWNVISDIDMVAEGIARKGYNKHLFDYAKDFGGYESVMMMEQTPDRDNKIVLSSKTDALQMPKIDVRYRVTEQDKQRVWRSVTLFADEIGRLDLGRVKLKRERAERLWSSQLGFSAHHIGTTRMGNTEVDGVVDSNCMVFGTNNFYIAGSSIFCTGGSVPPTLTIVALAVRLGKHLQDKLI